MYIIIIQLIFKAPSTGLLHRAQNGHENVRCLGGAVYSV